MDVINVGQFIPIIIMNASTHQALLSSQCLIQSRMPLSIAMAPLMLNACTASGQMQFLSYVTQCSVSLEDKVGPWPYVVPPSAPVPGIVTSLESDSNPDKGRDPRKTTLAPEPMETMGELMPLSSKVEPVIQAKHKLKEPAKEEPKVKVAPKVDPKDKPPAKAKPVNGLKGEPSKLPETPTLPIELMSQLPSMPSTTAAAILARIKKKSGIPAPPAPTYPSSSRPATSTPGRKSDPSKGLPSKWKKTSATPNSQANGGKSTVEILSSSKEGASKSKAKSNSKKKWSSKKPKSAATVDADMSDKVVSPKKHGPLPPLALNKQAGHHEDKWCEDLCTVIDYRGHHNIYPHELDGVNANDESDYINQMSHDETLGLDIHDAHAMRKRSKASTVKSDRVKYERLKDLMHAPMCKEKDAKVLYVVECFVHLKTKQQIVKGDEDGYNSQAMLGLYGLHHHKAISKVTTSDTGLPKGVKPYQIMEGYCSYCAYTSENHLSLNNHIWMHECLSLLCQLGKCIYIEWQAEKMCKHGAEVHKIAWADPACKPSEDK